MASVVQWRWLNQDNFNFLMVLIYKYISSEKTMPKNKSISSNNVVWEIDFVLGRDDEIMILNYME